MIFDRTGYTKDVMGSDLARAEKSVLIYLATYCEPDRTISVSQHTAKRIGPQIGMTNYTVGRAIQSLKDAGMLDEIEKRVEADGKRRTRKFYRLPTEQKLATYTPKK